MDFRFPVRTMKRKKPFTNNRGYHIGHASSSNTVDKLRTTIWLASGKIAGSPFLIGEIAAQGKRLFVGRTLVQAGGDS